MEGFDFKPWIDEMGLEALPFQTTIFPIQMNGWSYDYMLAMDDENCPKRAKAKADAKTKSTVDTAVKALVEKASLPDSIKSHLRGDWEGFCDYISWAYTESVELQDDMQEQAYTTCQACRKVQAQQFHALEKSDALHGLSTQQLRTHLKDQTEKWLQNYQVENGQITVNPKDRRKTSLEGTAGTENPQYFMFWTNEDLLNLIGQSIVDDSNADFLPLGPSSSVLIEYTVAD